jgi:hypothetical protein
MEQEQQNKENIHFFNYWEAKEKDHKIPHQKFITQTKEFWLDAQNNALTPHYITRMKKLLLSCKRNVITIHKEDFLEKDIEIKCQIMGLQQAIIEAQMEIESLQIDLHLNKQKYKKEKQEIKNHFQEIKNFTPHF